MYFYVLKYNYFQKRFKIYVLKILPFQKEDNNSISSYLKGDRAYFLPE